ncbi:MAG: hypothetical protein FJW40_20635 [Acidobacteria bacterium]|nr:hypothetical protein [Acidobacteriota bacterium]
MKPFTITLLLVVPLPAQFLSVRSEFQRIGPDGQAIAVDRMESPREILSPAIARGAYASFHLVVESPPGKPFTLYIGQNPENAVTATLYRIHATPNGVPDRLERVDLPHSSSVPEGASAAAFWLDLAVPFDAPVRRIKIEPQMFADERWIVYPMEARVIAARVPAHSAQYGELPLPSARSDYTVYGPMRRALCGTGEPKPSSTEPTIRRFIHRNVQQDMALALRLPKDRLALITRPTGVDAVEDWCSATTVSTVGGLSAEWYLRVRDFVYREGDKVAISR